MSNLLTTVAGVIEGTISTKPLRINGTPEFQHAIDQLVPMIEQMVPGIPNARWVAIRLLDGDSKVQSSLLKGELPELMARQRRADTQFSRRMAVEGRQ
jgi:ferrous iron transport protein B